VDFHGEKRSNQTHESTTDPDALLARKGNGKEAKLSYNGNVLTENRNGLIVNTETLQANGTAERDAALLMLEQVPRTDRVTVGADKGYDTKDFVAECRHMNVTPHVAQNVPLMFDYVGSLKRDCGYRKLQNLSGVTSAAEFGASNRCSRV